MYHAMMALTIDRNRITCSVIKKCGPITPPTQIPHQAATRRGYCGRSWITWGFSKAQMRQFCFFTNLLKSKWASPLIMIFPQKLLVSIIGGSWSLDYRSCISLITPSGALRLLNSWKRRLVIFSGLSITLSWTFSFSSIQTVRARLVLVMPLIQH